MKEPQLNENNFYKLYPGRILIQMQQILSEDRVPLSVADILKQRDYLNNTNCSDKVKAAWNEKIYDTGDLWLRHPDGRGKIVLYDKTVHDFFSNLYNLRAKTKDGALVISEKRYDLFDGLELDEQQIESHQNSVFPEVFKYLGREIVTSVNDDMSSVYFGNKDEDVAVLRHWYVKEAGMKSTLNSTGYVDRPGCNLIGKKNRLSQLDDLLNGNQEYRELVSISNIGEFLMGLEKLNLLSFRKT